ncbi:hypothetical protein ACFL5L_00650 [candidate division KSB1 bacterium]
MGGPKKPAIENPLFENTVQQEAKAPADSPTATEFDLDAGNRKASILKVIEELKSQIESSYEIRDALQSDLGNAKGALNNKEKEVDELNSQLISIKNQLPTLKGLEDEIKFLNQELEKTHERVDSLEKDQQEKENTIKHLQSNLISAEQEKSKVIQEMRSEVEKSRDLQRELTKVYKERDNALMEIKPMESEIKKLRESRQALEEIHTALADTKRAAKR